MKRYLTAVATIDAVPLQELVALGVRGLIFDLDNTLVAAHSEEVPAATTDFLREARRLGLATVIVSNARRPRAERLGQIMSVPVVARARKPFAGAYRKGLAVLQLPGHQVAAVGDHFLTDGLGALRQGMPLVLVDPISRDEDFLVRAARPVDYVLRRLLLPRRRAGAPGTPGSPRP